MGGRLPGAVRAARRLVRWLWNGLAVVSLLLALAAAGLWVRSYYVIDYWVMESFSAPAANPYHVFASFGSNRGEVEVLFDRGNGDDTQPHPLGRQWRHCTESSLFRWMNDREFRFGSGPWYWINGIPASNGWNSVLDFPYLFLFCVLGFPALAWLAIWFIKHRKHRPGCCIKCGYDLRATPDRCPECGYVPNQLQRTPATPTQPSN